MLTRTPLSTKAQPWTPLSSAAAPFTSMTFGTMDASPSQQFSSGANGKQMLSWLPVFAVSNAEAEAVPEEQSLAAITDGQPTRRGRKSTRERRKRLPSRTPSPSGASVCLSEVSTVAESQEGSTTGASVSGDSEVSNELKDFVVKNTFIHFNRNRMEDEEGEEDKIPVVSPKLSRSGSAPGNLQTVPFKAYTMPELHEMGKCHPCAYLYGKADGCRRGEECRFCHECPPEELKTRKKLRAKALKARRAALKAEQAALVELAEPGELDTSD